MARYLAHWILGAGAIRHLGRGSANGFRGVSWTPRATASLSRPLSSTSWVPQSAAHETAEESVPACPSSVPLSHLRHANKSFPDLLSQVSARSVQSGRVFKDEMEAIVEKVRVAGSITPGNAVTVLR